MIHIVVTGPESSGKTTLSRELAEMFDGILVEEYAREYVANINRPYKLEDIAVIAEGQKKKLDAVQTEIIVSDTAFLVLKVWAQYRFDTVPENVEMYLKTIPVDLYVLCHPEIPWEYDPLRENPDSREELFEMYQQELEGMTVPYIIVRGTKTQRLQMVLDKMREQRNLV